MTVMNSHLVFTKPDMYSIGINLHVLCNFCCYSEYNGGLLCEKVWSQLNIIVIQSLSIYNTIKMRYYITKSLLIALVNLISNVRRKFCKIRRQSPILVLPSVCAWWSATKTNRNNPYNFQIHPKTTAHALHLISPIHVHTPPLPLRLTKLLRPVLPVSINQFSAAQVLQSGRAKRRI